MPHHGSFEELEVSLNRLRRGGNDHYPDSSLQNSLHSRHEIWGYYSENCSFTPAPVCSDHDRLSFPFSIEEVLEKLKNPHLILRCTEFVEFFLDFSFFRNYDFFPAFLSLARLVVLYNLPPVGVEDDDSLSLQRFVYEPPVKTRGNLIDAVGFAYKLFVPLTYQVFPLFGSGRNGYYYSPFLYSLNYYSQVVRVESFGQVYQQRLVRFSKDVRGVPVVYYLYPVLRVLFLSGAFFEVLLSHLNEFTSSNNYQLSLASNLAIRFQYFFYELERSRFKG